MMLPMTFTAMQAYEYNQRRLLDLIRAGKYGTEEANAMMEQAHVLWGQLSPEEQDSVEGSLLTEHEFTGEVRDGVMPQNIQWTPANASA